jgi:hypothetical protein
MCEVYSRAKSMSIVGSDDGGHVDPLPLPEFAIRFFHFQRARRDLIELLGVGKIGAFDRAVEF